LASHDLVGIFGIPFKINKENKENKQNKQLK
jgi:hypothetical protein